MYYTTPYTFIFLIRRKKNNQEISLNKRNIFLGLCKNCEAIKSQARLGPRPGSNFHAMSQFDRPGPCLNFCTGCCLNSLFP